MNKKRINTILDKYINDDYNYDYDTNRLIIGNLYIEKIEQNDIELFELIQHINGDLVISNTTQADLNLFNSLISVNRIIIEDNLNMININGFTSVTNINTLVIKNNKKLSHIDGFTNFTKNNIMENIRITNNKKLDNISFLSGLSKVKKSFFLHNNSLKTLEGLESLESVGYSFSLSFNKLSSLENLSNLTGVNGVLNLKNNNLKSLSGLENLRYVKNKKWNNENRSITLENNNHLNDISALSNLKDKSGTLVLSFDETIDIKEPNINSIYNENNIIKLDPKYYKIVNSKKVKKRIAGIISTRNMPRFLKESKKIYDDSIEIIPNEVVYIFDKGSNEIKIDYNGFILNNLELLFIYSIDSPNDKESVLYLTKLLESINCSVCACRPQILGKLDRTIYEAPMGYESRQYVVSSYKAAKKLFKEFTPEAFPLISKPINGAGGSGIEKLDDLISLMDYIKGYYKKRTKPLIIEHYFNLIKEWRVFVVDGVVVTSYEKIRTTDTFKFNISQGAIPQATTKDDQEKIKEYVGQRLIAPYDKGYYGLDVALKDNGELFLIEYNMQAGIAYAKETSGVDIVYEMFKILSLRGS